MQRFVHLPTVEWVGLEVQTKAELGRVEKRNTRMYYLKVNFDQIEGKSIMDNKARQNGVGKNRTNAI